MKTVIIGGVAGGASAAARLRRLDEARELVLLEKGEYISFANCGLPYYIGGEIADRDELLLQTPESFHARFRVDVRVGNEAVALDTANKTVTVRRLADGSTYEEPYDELVLSTGAYPLRPPLEGLDSPKVFTLRSVPDADAVKAYVEKEKPRSAVVVGGGFIGLEMAENLRGAGLEVTVVEMADQVLPPFDFEVARDVERQMQARGVRLMLKTALKSVRGEGDALRVVTDRGEIDAGLLIMAAGVRPDTGLARDAGLALNERGSIRVDDHMRTSAPSVYAVGDAVEITDFVTGQPGFVPLAGPANKQGRIAADNIAGLDSRYTGTQGSSVVRVFGLTAASTGINEKTAKRLGLPYDKTYLFPGSHAGYFPGASSLLMKVIFDRTDGRILGAQIVGADGADKRVDVLAAAIRFGATAYDLTRLELCYAPPFSSAKDPVNMAGYVIENQLEGRVKTFHWHEVDSLPRDGSVTLLDVRTPGEYARGHLEGFRNLPLDSLRERLSEIDRSKPVMVTCQVGLRGYLACRILSQHGFDCANLSGGYRLYCTAYGN